MRISRDFCRLWECSSNPDNCGCYPRDCALKAMYVALDNLVTKSTKYSYMGISQPNNNVKEAEKLLKIIEG